MGKSTTADNLSCYNPEVIKGIRACVDLNHSILLVGETGTGKTTLINELAKEKKKELIRVSLNGATSTDDILGKYQAKDGTTYWQDGILVTAMKKGYWIVFDEINACLPEVLFVLQSLLDADRKVTLTEKDGEVIRPTGDFRFFACMNPTESYAGTKEVNMALMSRFGGVFSIAVFESHHELEVLKRNEVEEPHAIKLVNFANKLRDMRTKGDVYTFVSTRDIIQAGQLASKGLELINAIEYSVLNKMTEEERADLRKIGSLVDFIAKPYVSEEVKKLTEAVERSKKEIEQYKHHYEEMRKEKDAIASELSNLKKNPVSGLTGIDPKKAQILKALGIDVTVH